MSYIPADSLKFFTQRMLLGACRAVPQLVTSFAVDDATRNQSDPSKCKWLLNFAGGAIGWSAKLAVDADGPAKHGEGHQRGSQLDPEDGQDATSLRMADGSPLSSEAIPFYVLPGGLFGQLTGLELGDLGVVIYKEVIAAAILGDVGPPHKIGEGSIALHQDLRPAAADPCHRDDSGRCLRIHDVSIPEDVIALFFRQSKILISNEESAREQIRNQAFALFKVIGGVIP